MLASSRAYAITLFCALGVIVGSERPASAQAVDQKIDAATEAPPFLVTSFVAMGDDLAKELGAAFAFAWTSRLRLEVEASIGTDAARSSVSVLYNLPLLSRFVYVAGGAGVQRDEVTEAELYRLYEAGQIPAPWRVSMKKTEFAVNIGAGVVVPVGDRWSYRADFRWYNPDNAWPESWRASNGIVFGLRR